MFWIGVVVGFFIALAGLFVLTTLADLKEEREWKDREQRRRENDSV